MTWAKLDDKLHSRGDTLVAGNEAMGVWVRGESYCADHETDGALPRAVVELISGGKKSMHRLGALLVKAGFWVETPDGYYSVGFLDRNPSKAESDAKRAAEASRKQAQRVRRPGVGPGNVPVGHELDTETRPAVRPEDVPPGQEPESRGVSRPRPTAPDPVPVPVPVHAGADTPARLPARARVHEPTATWPSPDHERAAERYLAALEERTGRPAQYRASALAMLAAKYADTFVGACDDACTRDVGWQGWHVTQPRNWLETLCKQVGDERARPPRATPAKAPPSVPKGGHYGDGYTGPKQIGTLR